MGGGTLEVALNNEMCGNNSSFFPPQLLQAAMQREEQEVRDRFLLQRGGVPLHTHILEEGGLRPILHAAVTISQSNTGTLACGTVCVWATGH